jgi:transcription-repair coupling factor (superfamily II helicase)
MHDLEIRGRRSLGESQSGQMQEIGFNLYTEMLNAAVKSLKAGKEPDLSQPLAVNTEINLHAPALLPRPTARHPRAAGAVQAAGQLRDAGELELLQEELVDRFGLLPDPAKALADSHRLRIEAKPLGISKVDAGPESIVLQFIKDPPVDPARIIQLIQTRRNFKLSGPDRLRIEEKHPQVNARVTRARELFRELAQPAAAKTAAG